MIDWTYDEHTDQSCEHDWNPISISGANEFCSECGGVRSPAPAPPSVPWTVLGHSLDFTSLTPLSMEVSLNDVDPNLLNLLTGQTWEDRAVKGPQSYAIEMVHYIPVRRRAWRVVWEWLTRTPRKHREVHYHVPRAQVSGNSDGSTSFTAAPPST